MKGAVVEEALLRASAEAENNFALIDPCTTAAIVYRFLSTLIQRSGWVERQILRTVRGFVKQWMDRNDCRVPDVGV